MSATNGRTVGNGAGVATAAPPATVAPPSHAEAPASVTIRARLQGYDVMLTFRGESGAEVLPRTLAALSWLQSHDAQPTAEGGRKGGGAPTDPNAPRCPTHGAPMRQGARGWYCPRKVEGGEYCRETSQTK